MFSGLRPYQIDLFERGMRALNTKRRVLLQCPTGGGKTVIATAIAQVVSGLDQRVWFVCHRAELVFQTSLTFQASGVAHSFIAAGRPYDAAASVHICSVDTLKSRLTKVDIQPNLVIWDECHHVGAAGWTAVMNAYPDAWHVGLSATPCRLDGKGLDSHFDELIQGPSVAWLIEQGSLSKFDIYSPSEPDLRGVKTSMGDYKQDQLEAACNRPALIGDAVAHHARLAGERLTVVFAVSVKHSLEVVEAFQKAGVPAAHLDGNTPREERAEIIRRFAAGEVRVLSNVSLFGEGFDLSAIAGKPVTIDCVILLRPTQSLSLYLQQVGRALRPAPGKVAIVLDHAGNFRRHGWPDEERTWTLKGRDKKSKDQAEGPPPPLTCGNCYGQIRRPAPHACPLCGVPLPIQARMPVVSPGELKRMQREALEAEKAAKAAAKEAAKRERELRKQREAEEKKQAAIARKQEEKACKTMEELIELGKRRGYKNPAYWAESKYGVRYTSKQRAAHHV